MKSRFCLAALAVVGLMAASVVACCRRSGAEVPRVGSTGQGRQDR